MSIRENYEQWLKDFADDQETVRDRGNAGSPRSGYEPDEQI